MLVGGVMMSNNDWMVMPHAADALKLFGVPGEARVVSSPLTGMPVHRPEKRK